MLQRLPGERASNGAKVLGLLCTNRHTEVGVLVCDSAPTLLHGTHRPQPTDRVKDSGTCAG